MRKTCKALVMFFAVLCGLCLYTGSAKAATTLVPTQLVSGNEAVTAKYTLAVPAKANGAMVYPVTVSKPGELFIRINSSNITDDIEFSLWKDAACNYPAASAWDSKFTADPGEVKTGSMPVSTAGTYYLRVEYDWTGIAAGTVNISPYLVSSADRAVGYNTWTAFAPDYNSRYMYAKVNITGNGYIGIAQQNASASNMTVALCNSGKNAIEERYGMSPNKTHWYPVKKGTYWIRTKGIGSISKIKYTFVGNFSASQGRQVTIPLFGTGVFDVKIKAEKTGLLNLTQYYANSWDVTFLNSKKSPISNSMFQWGGTTSVAVKKGQTYYFRLKASNGNDDRVLSYSISGAKTAKNTSKKKAIKLKKGKKKTIVIASGDKKWHYFKFKLPKKKIPNISVTASGNGSYTCGIVKVRGTFTKYINSTATTEKFSTFLKLRKGTWYFRIKATNKSSGKFTVKWK